ncbi:uncharacterized protein LOC105207457 [Solenopsis invicta]|uniref:uncharacterized protein LOC105207457 n=1 Tax=Solenopsis invicta TaxID=13686 RepID=UPI00059604ED|nr:uncharacterized protein LOC105207457 [Solenopsis invicta]
MWKLGTYGLTHPESLSEHQLREILQNSCIESNKFEKLCRGELLEIYKRIAMPLPQRQHGNTKGLSTVDGLSEKSVTAVSDNDADNSNKGTKRPPQTSHSQVDKLKSSFHDQKSASKKIRLSSMSKVEVGCNGIYKRSCEEQSEESPTRKHQKITWP